MFKRKRQTPEAQTPTVNPWKRLGNLERARLKVELQLANPNLAANHRPNLERKLTSISDEIESLKEAASWN